MGVNGMNGSKCDEWERMGENGREWERMGENGREWERMRANGSEWKRMGMNEAEWLLLMFVVVVFFVCVELCVCIHTLRLNIFAIEFLIFLAM
jgi:hypothetical protein